VIAAAVLVIASCKKKEDITPIDLGYDYFPNEVGKFIEYEVDSTHYGITEQDFHFYVREERLEDYVDGEGQVAVRIERFKKTNLGDQWVLSDVWVQKRTSTTAERLEENRRFVRLAFPVNIDQKWDGNAYNDLDEWEHSYESIGVSKSFGALPFSKTLTVNQRHNVNLVDQEIAEEVYAFGVGLVYKKFIDLNFQNFEVTGVEYEMTVTDYGWID
jgi:hypothetical protein